MIRGPGSLQGTGTERILEYHVPRKRSSLDSPRAFNYLQSHVVPDGCTSVALTSGLPRPSSPFICVTYFPYCLFFFLTPRLIRERSHCLPKLKYVPRWEWWYGPITNVGRDLESGNIFGWTRGKADEEGQSEFSPHRSSKVRTIQRHRINW